MAAIDEDTDSGFGRRLALGSTACLLVFFAIWLFLPRTQPPRPGDGAASATPAAVSSKNCERRLNELLDSLHPTQVGLSTDAGQVVAELGQWWSDCGVVTGADKVETDAAADARWLSGDFLTRTSSDGYSLHDGLHIAASRLCGDIAAPIGRNSPDPRRQALDLFTFVVRHVALIPDEVPSPAQTPYDSLLFGQGKAADRAWVFALLLRQLRLDAVIVEPAGDKSASWLVGVLLPPQDLLLFDVRLGLPLPGPKSDETKPWVDQPATLQDVRADDSLLRRLDTPQGPYPLSSADLQAVRLRLIGDSSTFSRRMARLQFLVAGVAVELFDGLGTSSLRDPGLAQRVVAAGAAGGWAEQDVAVWEYPEKQFNAYIQAGGERTPELLNLYAIFAGPEIFSTAIDPDADRPDARSKGPAQFSITRSQRPLRLVRIQHLIGDLPLALSGYLSVRTSARRLPFAPADPNLAALLNQSQQRNSLGADYACYWTALVQLEQGKPAAALETVDQYSRDFPLGARQPVLAELVADALVHDGDSQPALASMSQISPNRLTPRLAALLSRWTRQHAAPPAANPPAGLDSEAPAADSAAPAEPAAAPPESAEPAPEDNPAPPGDSPAADAPHPAAQTDASAPVEGALDAPEPAPPSSSTPGSTPGAPTSAGDQPAPAPAEAPPS